MSPTRRNGNVLLVASDVPEGQLCRRRCFHLSRILGSGMESALQRQCGLLLEAWTIAVGWITANIACTKS